MKNEPYVGITGFMSKEEIEVVLEKAKRYQDPERKIMVGVLASNKTMSGVQNKYPNRYPVIEKMRSIFPKKNNTLNFVHYSTDGTEDLLQQILRVSNEFGSNLNGLQLNIAWPEVKVLEAYKGFHPEKKVVLQIGKRALGIVGNNPNYFKQKFRDYLDLVDYALLDMSAGKGELILPETIIPFLEKLSPYQDKIGLAVAGGLSPSTLESLRNIIKDFPRVSIDAESRLRTREDHLDLGVGIKYLEKSFEMFSPLPTKKVA